MTPFGTPNHGRTSRDPSHFAGRQRARADVIRVDGVVWIRTGHWRQGIPPERFKILRNCRSAKVPRSERSSGARIRVETSLEIVVRCTEIDVNGHVNNAKFVEYL